MGGDPAAQPPRHRGRERRQVRAGRPRVRPDLGLACPMSALDAVFRPGSVAVYGASRQPTKLGHVLLRNVLTGGFDGPVVPVNPSREEVLGRPSVDSLAEPVDLALVSVPA